MLPTTRKYVSTLVLLGATAFALGQAPLAHADSGITGRVAGQDEQGKFVGMVSGATIEILQPGGAIAATTTSNARGMFKLALPPGRYYYRLHADGYKEEDAGRGFEVKRSDTMELFSFALTKGDTPTARAEPVIPPETQGTLQGRVLEQIGEDEYAGIRFAHITLVNEETREVEEVDARPRGGVGIDYGEFRIRLTAGTWHASVRARGFARYVDPDPILITVGETTGRTFKLRSRQPSAELLARQGIRGEILIEEDGRTSPPPFAVTLRVLRASDRSVLDTQTTSSGETEFRFDTPSGSYFVVASASGSGFAKAVSPPVFVFPARHSTVQLRMHPLEIPELEPELHIIEPEYIGPEPTADPLPDDEPIADVSPRSEPGALEIIAVHRQTKQPLVETEILLREVSDRKATVIRGRTGSDGVARFKVAEGKYFVVARLAGFEVVHAMPEASFIRGRLVLEVLTDKRTQATFVFDRLQDVTPTSGLVVEVEDEKAGVPVVGATVAITRAMLKPRLLTTNANGEVSVPDATAGRYSIQVTHAKYLPRGREINFDPSKPRHHFAMYRRPTDTTRSYAASGAVLFQSETGLGTALIPNAQLTWVGPNTVRDVSDELGRYRVNVLRGTYTVTVTPPADSDFVARTFTGVVVDADLTRNFILRRRSVTPALRPQVQVNVYDERSRRPIRGATVSLQRAGSGGASAASGTTATNGQVNLSLASAGSYLANVSATGYTPRRIAVTATAGRIAVVNAAMRPSDSPSIDPGPTTMTVNGWVITDSATSLRPAIDPRLGRFTKPDPSTPDWRRSQPVANAQVLWYFPGERGLPGAVRLARTNTKGRFTIDNIPEGSYTVTVRAVRYQDQTQRISVRRAMRDPVFNLKPADRVRPVDPISPSTSQHQLTVQVLDQTRKGVGGATVTIMRGNTPLQTGQTNASGRYVSTVAAGSYAIKASGSMIHPGGTQVNVRNNTTATVSVRRTTSGPSTSQSGRTQIQYVAQYRAPGTKNWKTIGAYNDRKTAELALKRAKIPVKSQTQVVPQTRATPARIK